MTRLVVKHHQPWRTWGIALGLAAAVAASIWGAFIYGESRAGFDRRASMALKDALAEAQAREEALNEQITVLQRQRQVDQASRQQVQGSLEDLQRKLADQQEELSFYKGIVSPGAGEEGIRVQSVKFTNGGAPRLYHYRLVLIQVRTREFRVSGNVAVKIYGVQDGKPVILDAHDLAPNGKTALGFGFQYFQNLEGDAFFPVGFLPGKVEVTVQESGHEPVQQNFDWTSVII